MVGLEWIEKGNKGRGRGCFNQNGRILFVNYEKLIKKKGSRLLIYDFSD